MNILEETIVEMANRNLSNLWKVNSERDVEEERRVKETLWVAIQATHLVLMETYRIPEKRKKKEREQ